MSDCPSVWPSPELERRLSRSTSMRARSPRSMRGACRSRVGERTVSMLGAAPRLRATIGTDKDRHEELIERPACLSARRMLACPIEPKEKERSMNTNPLAQLITLGQSVWLDVIRRNMLVPGGEMQKLIERDSVRGVTSNPAIFEKAINGSADYDDEIRSLGRKGKDAVAIYEALAIEDVGRAADFFRPLYDSTKGAD